MKPSFLCFTLLFSVLLLPQLFAQEQVIELDGVDEGERNYGEQLALKFTQLIEQDKKLNKEFESYAQGAKDDAGGRYMGAEAQALILTETETVDFNAEGGQTKYAQKLVLYFSFGEGFRKGMAIESGVFALFDLTGEIRYEYTENDESTVKDHQVSAQFLGFQKTLEAPENR